MADSLLRWRWGVAGTGLAALVIALGCSQSSTTPESQTPARMGAAGSAVETGASQVGAERSMTVQVSPQEAEQIAANAYIYAYPLMVMAVTKDVMTATQRPDPKALKAPINQAVSATAFPDPKFGDVVRPNFDTLYTSAWMDLAAEPLVLSVPDMGERYYLLPMLDAWTNVFAVPGTRTTGGDAADYVITGPTFRGTVPEGMRQIKAPTRYVWMIGRIATKPGADEKAVRELESQIRLVPLSRHGDRSTRTIAASYSQNIDTKTKPPVQVARMTPQKFFGRFAELTRDNPPTGADQPSLASFAKLGIVPGKPFDIGSLSPEVQQAVVRGMASGQKVIENKLQDVMGQSGWFSFGNEVGQYGTNYTQRAVVALGGLGANLAADAVYPGTGTDSEGRPLEGTHKYLIRFREAPPAQAFWSLTVYDEDGYVVKNPIDRYSLGSQYPLSKGPDGSTVILLQPSEPKSENERRNWLPIPQGKRFNLTLRLYQPEQKAMDGTWKAPAIERVD